MSYSGNVKRIEGVALDTHDSGSMPSDVRTWNGTAPNALQSGRVDVNVQANNDKTGYSLTAGSYVVRASSSQQSSVSLTDAVDTTKDATISSVTTTRAISSFGEGSHSSSGTDNTNLENGRITAATTYHVERNSNPGNDTVKFEIVEFL